MQSEMDDCEGVMLCGAPSEIVAVAGWSERRETFHRYT